MAEFFGQRFAYTQRIVWMDNLKYVFNAFDEDEFYDLSKDPHEIKDLIGKDLFAYLDKNYKEMNFEPGMIGEFDYSNGNYIVCYKKHIVSIINNEIHCNNQEILREKANKIYKLMQ